MLIVNKTPTIEHLINKINFINYRCTDEKLFETNYFQPLLTVINLITHDKPEHIFLTLKHIMFHLTITWENLWKEPNRKKSIYIILSASSIASLVWLYEQNIDLRGKCNFIFTANNFVISILILCFAEWPIVRSITIYSQYSFQSINSTNQIV